MCYSTEPKKFPKPEEAKRPQKQVLIAVALAAAVVVLSVAAACTVFALEIVKLQY